MIGLKTLLGNLKIFFSSSRTNFDSHQVQEQCLLLSVSSLIEERCLTLIELCINRKTEIY